MNNILQLVKVSLRESLDFRSMKKEKGKTITFGLFIILMGALFLFLSVVYNLLFAFMYKDFNQEIIYPTIVMVGIASMLILTTSIPRVKSLFIGADYDMLASMPLTKREIIASKIITFYLTELLFSAIVMIPNIIINVLFWNDPSFILVGTIIMFFLPVFPIVISCFIGTLIALFAEKSKFGNIITTLLYTIFFIFIMYTSLSLDTNAESGIESLSGITNMFGFLNPTTFLLELAYTSSFVWFIVYCGLNILLFVVTTLFLALSYESIHVMINTVKSNVKYERKKLENKNQFKALLGIEFKRLFNSKLYFLNSCIGGILLVIMSVSLGVSAKDIMMELGDIKDYLHLVALFIMFILGMTTPAACSINMEGKTFWITKTLPIDYKVYAKVKIATSVIILGLCSVISSIVLIIFLEPNIIQSLAILVLPLLYVVAISSLDLLINLFFTKLNWKNEQEAVKNSASTLISMLSGLILPILIGIIYILLNFVSMYLSILVTTIIVGIIAWLLYFINIRIINNRIELIEQ